MNFLIKLKSVIVQIKNMSDYWNHTNHEVVLRSTWGHCRRNNLNKPMFITAFILLFLHEGHREPCGEIGSLAADEHPVGFEPGTFRFDCNILTGWATLVFSYFKGYRKRPVVWNGLICWGMPSGMKWVNMLGYAYQEFQIKGIKRWKVPVNFDALKKKYTKFQT